MALAACHGVHQHHGKAAGGGLGGAQSAGLCEKQVGAVHQLGHIVHHAQDADVGMSAELFL